MDPSNATGCHLGAAATNCPNLLVVVIAAVTITAVPLRATPNPVTPFWLAPSVLLVTLTLTAPSGNATLNFQTILSIRHHDHLPPVPNHRKGPWLQQRSPHPRHIQRGHHESYHISHRRESIGNA